MSTVLHSHVFHHGKEFVLGLVGTAAWIIAAIVTDITVAAGLTLVGVAITALVGWRKNKVDEIALVWRQQDELRDEVRAENRRLNDELGAVRQELRESRAEVSDLQRQLRVSRDREYTLEQRVRELERGAP